MNENFKTLTLDCETLEKIRYISDFTKRTQISLIREYVENMFQICSTFKSGNFWFNLTGKDEILINWHGVKNQINLYNEKFEEGDTKE